LSEIDIKSSPILYFALVERELLTGMTLLRRRGSL
jgi:hypothetical protein